MSENPLSPANLLASATLPPWPLRCPGAPWVRMVPDRPNVVKAGSQHIVVLNELGAAMETDVTREVAALVGKAPILFGLLDAIVQSAKGMEWFETEGGRRVARGGSSATVPGFYIEAAARLIDALKKGAQS